MNWETYCDEFGAWPVRTAVKKLSELEEVGNHEEVADVVSTIGEKNKRGADRLLQMAISGGVKFSGEDLVIMYDFCTETVFKAALYQSADCFTTEDLEFLSYEMDADLIAEVALKYGIPVPEELEATCEYLLTPDVGKPITWDRFYAGYSDWPMEYATARFGALISHGSEEEILEVLFDLFYEDATEAGKQVCHMLEKGILFSGDGLLELSDLIDEENLNRAFWESRKALSSEDLENLCGIVSAEMIEKVAKDQNLTVPEGLYDAESWDEGGISRAELAEAYDYVLYCLAQAHDRMVTAYNLATTDLAGGGRYGDFLKYECLMEAEPYVQEARSHLAVIESVVEDKISVRNTRLNMGAVVFHDICGNGRMADYVIQRRIRQMLKAVEDAQKAVLRLLRSV